MSNVMDFLNMSEEDGKQAASAQRDKARAGSFNFDNSFYPITKIPAGSSSRLRFLPDANEATYPNFWVVKKVFGLQFADPNSDKFFKLNIPCREMYETGKGACPLAEMVRPLYKEADELKKKGRGKEGEALSKRASEFWMDTQRIMQGFVIKSGIAETNVPENPVRFFSIGKKLFTAMNARINPPEGMEDQILPYWACHPQLGTDFFVSVNKQGDFRNYDSSYWANQPTPLTEAQIEAVKKYNYVDLTTKLPTRPSDDEYVLFTSMLEQAMSGNKVWDPDWEADLKALNSSVKPFKVNADGTSARGSENLASRVKATLGEDEGVEPTPAEQVLSVANRSGRTEEAPKAEPVAAVTVPSSLPQTPQPTGTGTDSVVNRIRAKMAAKKAAQE